MDTEDVILLVVVCLIGLGAVHFLLELSFIVLFRLLDSLFSLPGKLIRALFNQHKMTASGTFQYKVKDLDNWEEVKRQNPFKDEAE